MRRVGPHPTCVQKGQRLTEAQERVNKQLAQTQCVNEHCIGLLKGRFQSLRGMRLDIADPASAKLMVMYIRAAAALNNLLLGMSDEANWHSDLLYDYDMSNGESVGPARIVVPMHSSGQARRMYYCEKFASEEFASEE